MGKMTIIDRPRLANTSPAVGINAANVPNVINSNIAYIRARMALTEDVINVKGTSSIDSISLISTIFFTSFINSHNSTYYIIMNLDAIIFIIIYLKKCNIIMINQKTSENLQIFYY